MRPQAAAKDGWTPLHIAAAQGNVDAIDTLLQVCLGLQLVSVHL